MVSAIHAASINTWSDVSAIVPLLSTWKQSSSSLYHWIWKFLEQFTAHPKHLNSAYCTGALIIGMFCANHPVIIVNQEIVKNIHIYLKQTEINPPFWYDFYHIMKLWTKKKISHWRFWSVLKENTRCRRRKTHPCSLALLVSRATSPFPFYFSFYCRSRRGDKEKRKKSIIKWQFNPIRTSL